MSIERPGDPQALESEIDRAWRGASTESPAPHVDAAILAAARTPARSARAWQPFAAAAAVAGLAFVLVQLMPVQEPARSLEAPAREAQMATPATARQSPAGTPSEKAAPVRDATKAQDAAAIAPPETAPATTTSAESAARPAAPPAPSVQSQVLEQAGLAERSAPAPTAAAPITPETWVRQIAALYDANDFDGAAAELRAFRLAFPDADRHLPPALQQWAAEVE
jgi:hypothetical protein